MPEIPKMIPTHKYTAHHCNVKTSNIHGLGLFAKTEIQSEDIILEIQGNKIETNNLGDDFIAGGHWQRIAPGRCLISKEKTSFAFVNHSKTPTAKVDLENLRLVARQKIQPNVEITVDYDLEPMDQRCKNLLGKLKP